MDQLRFTGLNEDGTQLLMTATDGSRYAVPLTDGLRSAVRTSRTPGAEEASPLTPREVQALMRAGRSASDIAAQTDWAIERIQRYEGPILAEREHIASLAQASTVRSHERSQTPPTLGQRVTNRLEVRGVSSKDIVWDATRPEGGRWTVAVNFTAGARSRSAHWHFDVQARGLEAMDDEARWLSEDEQSLPSSAAPSNAVFGPPAGDEPDDLDLMNSMRERRRQRTRSPRGKKAAPEAPAPDTDADAEAELMAAHAALHPDSATGVGSADPSAVPGAENFPNEALPLEDFDYDPRSAGLPPGARGNDDRDTREATLEDFFGRNSDDKQDDEPQDEGGDGDGDGVSEESDAQSVSQHDDAEHHEQGASDSESEDFIEDEAGEPEEGEESAIEVESEPTPETEEAVPDPSVPDLSEEESSKAKKNRPSVPSWDDIMFGARGRNR